MAIAWEFPDANARGVCAAGIRLSATNCFEPLEDELRAKLHRSRIARAGNDSVSRWSGDAKS